MAAIALVPQVRRATTRATSKGLGLCTPTTERYSDERRPRFTSTEVVYGVTGTGVTELPEFGAAKGGDHLAILRSGFRATKESKVAAGDVVPVPGAQFEQTLASASPDVLCEMIRQFAQRMMDADVEVACNAGCGEVTPDRVNSRNGYRRRGVGHPRRNGRAGHPQTALGVVLSGVPGALAPRRAGAGLGRRDQLPAGRPDLAGGEAGGRLGRHWVVQVAGLRGGRGTGRAGGPPR